MIKRKAINKGPLGMGIFCGDKTKEIKEILQNILGEGYFEDKNNSVQDDKHPCDRRKPCTWNGVPEGYHD
ncbi:MAG: hypothetical protein ACXU9M_13980 [Thermodesulfobacteriota bacterium]